MKLSITLAFVVLLTLAATAGAQTKIAGTVQCAKADPQHMVPVGDRANHSLALAKSNCTWTKPIEMAGLAAKDGVDTEFDDMTGNNSRGSGYFVGTMANGDKFYVRYQGTATLKDGMPQTIEGTWSYTNGTGKLKGLKGKGTYKGKGNPDGGVTYEVEGDYQLPK